ncbi:hypothetical protein Tco_0907019 [Tanacetum coccineum]|uniref:Uncharacterized protein n=1 Tax=Tanacetum coccineum TaxID=301880 RepID=A0ABQ5CPE0_9ASTR
MGVSRSVGNVSNFSNDFKRSYIARVQLSPFAETYHSFPWRYFQHDVISYLKLKGFPSYAAILLPDARALDKVIDTFTPTNASKEAALMCLLDGKSVLKFQSEYLMFIRDFPKGEDKSHQRASRMIDNGLHA